MMTCSWSIKNLSVVQFPVMAKTALVPLKAPSMSRARNRRHHNASHRRHPCKITCFVLLSLQYLVGEKIPLDIQPSSFIPCDRLERGVRILAITLAFQAREAGSIPARRSNFSHARSVDRCASDCFQEINVLEQAFELLWCG